MGNANEITWMSKIDNMNSPTLDCQKGEAVTLIAFRWK